MVRAVIHAMNLAKAKISGKEWFSTLKPSNPKTQDP